MNCEYTGLNLSLCVEDICNGKILMQDVKTIYLAIPSLDENGWQRLLDRYKEYYWHNCAEQAEKVVGLLRNVGKIRIIPPEEPYPMIEKTGHWITSEKDIEWSR